MADTVAWLKENWFLLLQSLGISGGLLFTALSLRADVRARRTSDFLALAEHHRQLWDEIHQRPELARVMAEEADLANGPITVAEENFLNSVIVHFNTGWLIAREGALLTLEGFSRDVGTFFTLPLPRAVWNQTTAGRDPRFVAFVEACLSKTPAARHDHCRKEQL